MTARGIHRRRLAAAAGAIALVAGLTGCNVTLTGDVSRVDITRTCRGESDHVGSAPIRTQVTVTVDSDAGKPHHVLISLNDGAVTTGQPNVAPGNGVLYGDNSLNTTEIEVAVVPSDADGDFDTFRQTFNPCPPTRP
jgi:hypothetical protein